ncbi:hypothetical protein SNEBB_005237 [Seison nebaliae]|nr:hypothetical protein SNEBB_005237 [Seison nebaliae]
MSERDPFTRPANIYNKDNVCFSLTALQIIMASPSLMLLLYDHNHCTSFNCFQLSHNIPQTLRSFRPINSIKDIEYTYLVHEVMVMMGFHSPDNNTKGLSCTKHPYSIGCKGAVSVDTHPELHYGSLVLWNLYRLLSMKNNKKLIKKESTISNVKNCHKILSEISTQSVRRTNLNYTSFRKIPKRFYDHNARRKIWGTLKNRLYSTIPFNRNDRERRINKYLTRNNLDNNYNSIFMLLFNFLLHGHGGTADKQILAHTFHHNPLHKRYIDTKYNSLTPIPSKMKHDFVTYYPHLKLIFFQVSFDANKIIKAARNIKYEDFPSYFQQPWDDIIHNAQSLQVSRTARSLIIHYGMPSTVLFDYQESYFQSYSNPIGIVVAPSSIASLIDFIEKSYGDYKDGSFMPIERLLKMRFYDAKFTFPEKFWCDDMPCKKQFFKDFFAVHENNEIYELFGIILTQQELQYEVDLELDVGKSEKYKPIIPSEDEVEETIETVMNVPSIKAIFLKTNDDTAEQIIRYIRKYLRLLFAQENVYNYHQFNKIREIPDDVPPASVIHHEYVTHSVAIVRTFDRNWWLIDDDQVIKLRHLKEFFNEFDIKYTMTPELTAWQVVKNEETLLKRLRNIIKPIKYTYEA